MRKFFIHSVFALYLFGMVAAGWWPFEFRAPTDSNFQIESFRPELLSRRWRLERDMLKLALFVPVGIFLVTAWGAKESLARKLARAIGLGLLLSVAMQIGRVFLPGKFPSVSDIVMNVSGVALGASVICLHLFSRWILLVLLIACVLCFGLAATWPCHFTWRAAVGTALTSRLEWSPFHGIFSMGVLRERILNGLIMLPLGLLAATYALRKEKLSRALLFTTTVGFLSSLGVELLQCFLPYRTPSVSDLLLNTLGTLMGGVLAVGIERWATMLERPK